MAALILSYGVLVGLGGLIGYFKARSLKSLLSGVICGVLLAIAAYLTQANPEAGLSIASIVAAVLILVFGIRFRKTQKFMPAGFLAALSLGMEIAFLTALLRPS